MKKTLWIASLNVGYTHLLKVFYAANETEAEQVKKELERETGATCDDLKNYPRGFRVVRAELPGSVEMPDEAEGGEQ